MEFDKDNLKVNIFIITKNETNSFFINQFFQNEEIEREKQEDNNYSVLILNSNIQREKFDEFIKKLTNYHSYFEIFIDSDEKYIYEKYIYNNENFISKQYVPYCEDEEGKVLLGKIIFNPKQEKIYLK